MKSLLTIAGIILLISLTGNSSSAVKKSPSRPGPFAAVDSTIEKVEASCDRFVTRKTRP